MNIKEAIKLGATTLNDSSQTKELDTEMILSHILNKNRAFLYAHDDYELTYDEEKQFHKLLKKRLRHTPIAYLTHRKSFWTLDLYVNQNTLIPRPETEMLVELALTLCKNPSANVIDLGTGSGAIALALAKENPQWNVIGVDKSEKALGVAKKNKKLLRLKNVRFFKSDWFNNVGDLKFDIIISNPPYVAATEKDLLSTEVTYEPQNALISAEDGMQDIKAIIENSKKHLKPQSWILLEHGFKQKDNVHEILKIHGFKSIKSWKDLQGHYRISGGIYNPK